MIGETLYIQDENRRLYQDDAGNKTSTANIRYKWRPFTVVGETRDSWVLEFGVKISKATWELRAQRHPGLGRFAHTAEQMEDAIWRDTHRSAILRAVQDTTDTPTLRQIAALLGME